MEDLSAVQTQISGVNSNSTVVLNGSIFNLCSLTSDAEKNELVSEKFDVTSSTNLIGDSNVFVDTTKGLIFSVAEEGLNNVSVVSDLGLGTVNHGLDLATPTVPSQLLQHDPATTDPPATASATSFIQIVSNGGAAASTSDPMAQVTLATSKKESLADNVNTIVEIIPAVPLTNTILKPATSQQIAVSPPKRRGGWPKGKKRKEAKSSSIPKAPTTGYVFFANENRQRLKELHPESSFPEITKMLGAEWSAMPSHEKQKYLTQADADKKRYIEELKIYKEGQEYQNYLQQKRAKSAVNSDDGPGLDLDGCSPMDEQNSDVLYCKVCDQYFSSLHNRKEHMFGKTHLSNVSKSIDELTKQEPVARTTSGGSGSTSADVTSPPPPPQPPPLSCPSEPMDLEGFMLQFMEKNYERGLEVSHLRREVERLQNDNLALVNNIKEHEELHSKLLSDLSTAKAYGAALATQIDALRMVPTLFGVLHF